MASVEVQIQKATAPVEVQESDHQAVQVGAQTVLEVVDLLTEETSYKDSKA